MKPKRTIRHMAEQKYGEEAGFVKKMISHPKEAFRIYEADLQLALERMEANYAQLERTQSQLRAIIDTSPDALLFLTADRRPVMINARFTDYFGLDDVTILSQTPDELAILLKKLFESSNRLDQSQIWDTSDQEHIFQAELVMTHPCRREFDLSSLPVTNVDLTYIGRLYVWHDMTHEREIARVKATFASMVTHELRSPLTGIKGCLDLLLEDTTDDLSAQKREFLRIVRNETHRMLTLTNDLLDIARLESGSIEWHPASIDLGRLIDEVLSSFRLRWEDKHQSFRVHMPVRIPVVSGDADRVLQILTNLLSNAHKYTPEGGSIDLSIKVFGPVANIAITDTGIGLSEEEQAQIFTPFYRVRTTETRTTGGAGLGLTITRILVEMQGGEIRVSSKPGHGSTFSFTLPLAQENACSA
jgi:signal transduction histidine kinase